ncbi:SMI1/KNR4 family protein [Hymenobacter endophyticus]|uniref:SMI1/KNR4 family protein n=1 Tax=Hymenobacter endophyticus TaxID=3076335 RepID=A0ABU3TI47_9BACT|nr:SMI1/KNR4 family protein [Hymenobacter endophyticus]MDU0371053.1 SMI1/KNR4 family protein [Hymenobacter endophyticus]
MNFTTPAEWLELLQLINKEILTDPDFTDGNLAELVTPAQRQAGWLGAPGATEAEVLQLEQRLQTNLPPSYRTFLLASNGFGPMEQLIWRLRPIQEVDWLVNTDADLVTLWEKDVESIPSVPDEDYFRYDDNQIDGQARGEYFRGLLMISDWGDAGFWALNPAVQQAGEWEAWHFANWMPGAVRYRSFIELVQASFAGYKETRNG